MKQIDFDGSFSYSNTIAIKKSLGADVIIYPNSTDKALNLNFVSKEDDIYSIVINNVSKIVYTETIYVEKGNHIINLNYFENLAAGLSFIKIIDKQGTLSK